MRAQVIRGHGTIDDITFEPNWPDPKPGPDDVVLRVRACTLNYHDLFTLRGMPGIKLPMPLIMGIDLAGEVAETGSAVTGWKAGDRNSWEQELRHRTQSQNEYVRIQP